MSDYDWIELSWRPKRDGLHDSGYRFLRIVGVRTEKGEEVRDELHQWADHAVFYAPVNLDVSADGTLRIMPWHHGKLINDDEMRLSGGQVHYGSSAIFYTREIDKAVKVVSDLNRIHFEVRAGVQL